MLSTPLGFSRQGRSGGSTLVFLHGFLGCREDWLELVEPLASTYDLILIDLPGHGASVHCPQDFFRFARCSEALSETLNYLKVVSCTLVGYSMGGRLALYHALNRPDLAGSIVLIGANPGIESQAERLSRLAQDEQLAAQMAHLSMEEFVERWYTQPLFESLRNSPVYARIRARRTEGDSQALGRALSGFSIGRQTPMWESLPDLKTPVMYIAGELDAKYSAIGRRVADLCPTGKLDIIAKAGHAVHVEKPELVTQAIRSFLTGQS